MGCDGHAQYTPTDVLRDGNRGVVAGGKHEAEQRLSDADDIAGAQRGACPDRRRCLQQSRGGKSRMLAAGASKRLLGGQRRGSDGWGTRWAATTHLGRHLELLVQQPGDQHGRPNCRERTCQLGQGSHRGACRGGSVDQQARTCRGALNDAIGPAPAPGLEPRPGRPVNRRGASTHCAVPPRTARARHKVEPAGHSNEP